MVAHEGTADGSATVVIGQLLRPGCHDDYLSWQREVNAAAAGYPGFVGCEVRPPDDDHAEWLTVYRFDSAANLKSWINSASRQDLLDRAGSLFDGPGTLQVIVRDGQPDDSLVTVVVSHRVAPEQTERFLAWQREVFETERKFRGFRGSEVFRPVEGVQDEWTICYRFDNAENLDAWLTSRDRRKLLHDNDFTEFTLRRIDHSFGNWFSTPDAAGEPPSDFRTAIAVWMGLYPTVVLLTLLTSPLGMPLWLGMLIGNLLSSLAMTYLTMPRYVNPILGWWLTPRPDGRPAPNLRGLLLVLAVNAGWVVVFYLLTVQFWTLP
jgi:antibiotic biosynthesis monooxygenase (ABM) superfamily enzyme